jgi:hypothetical protein
VAAGSGLEQSRRLNLEWLRAHYPQAQPPSRRDVAEVRQWLEAQLQQLHSQAEAACPAPGSPGRPGGWQQQLAELQGPDAQLLVRCIAVLRCDESGYLQKGLLEQQEQIFTACFDELNRWASRWACLPLHGPTRAQGHGAAGAHAPWRCCAGRPCRQVSAACVDRGLLLAELWSAQRRLLVAALADRAAALASAELAQRQLGDARAAWHAEVEVLREDLVGAGLLNQRLSFHAAQVKSELLEWQAKHAEVGAGRGAWLGAALR